MLSSALSDVARSIHGGSEAHTGGQNSFWCSVTCLAKKTDIYPVRFCLSKDTTQFGLHKLVQGDLDRTFGSLLFVISFGPFGSEGGLTACCWRLWWALVARLLE